MKGKFGWFPIISVSHASLSGLGERERNVKKTIHKNFWSSQTCHFDWALRDIENSVAMTTEAMHHPWGKARQQCWQSIGIHKASHQIRPHKFELCGDFQDLSHANRARKKMVKNQVWLWLRLRGWGGRPAPDSGDQGGRVPIPRYPPLDEQSVNFMGRLVRELPRPPTVGGPQNAGHKMLQTGSRTWTCRREAILISFIPSWENDFWALNPLKIRPGSTFWVRCLETQMGSYFFVGGGATFLFFSAENVDRRKSSHGNVQK